MEQHDSLVFTNRQGVTARVCPRGVIALTVGHTSLTLRKSDFLRLAQAIRVAETRAWAQQGHCRSDHMEERSH